MSATRLTEQLERIAEGLGVAEPPPVQLDRPRNPSHGDLATNLAMIVAQRLGRPPREIAEAIVSRIELRAAGLSSAEVAGPGFINFRLAPESLQEKLLDIIEQDQRYGASATENRRIQVEFVSANPTGPLHVAHGRGAALGDAIASLLEWTGGDVQREFYVNDAGAQVDRLAESVEIRWRELHGETIEFPEAGYHGEYVRELAAEIDDKHGDEIRALEGAERLAFIRAWSIERLRDQQDHDLRDFAVRFDNYYSETGLYERDELTDTLRELAEKGLTYESEGAVWLRTSEHGDDKDRVLVKSDGSFTYFLPDLAYHRDKARRGFQHVIDVWGADHHGYVPRMQAALAALGLENVLDVEIVQMVRIMRGGREVKLSKRSGQFVTLRELADECGTDVARYFFLMRRGDTQMVFDLDLALDHSEKNPVYKVQYAHARMMSIFRKAEVDPEAAIDVAGLDLGRLEHETETELIKQLGDFPETVVRAARARAPHMICDYLETTAGLVNSWYHAGNPSRNPELAVLVDDPTTRAARLTLARAVRIVLRNGLHLLSLNAPDRMEREASE
jgi:arginyl-tRNA synthetase